MANSVEDMETAPTVTTTLNDTEDLEVSENEVYKIKLVDLKVADLKAELDKRKLDKSGVKSTLVERLKNALIEAGENPEEFIFNDEQDSDNLKSSGMKKTTETNGEICKQAASDDIKINTSEVTAEDTFVEIKETSVSSEEVAELKSSPIVESENFSEEPAVNEPSIQPEKHLEASSEEIMETNEDENTPETMEINEDKNIHEVTLQITIDEEDAQLNEDEAMEILKVSDTECEAKVEEPSLISDVANSESEEKLEPEPEKALNKEASPSKSSKITDEEFKDKRNAKTSAPPKTPENPSAVSQKVLKVIGKSDKAKNASVLAKSLWITGLPNTTRAADLKELFGKQGRVTSVKIVKSIRQTPVKTYGFITMLTSKDATKAIQNLHRTELNGRTISVERTQSEPGALLKKSESKQTVLSTKKVVTKKEPAKAAESGGKTPTEPKSATKVESKTTDSKPSAEQSKSKEEKPKSTEKSKSKERDQKARERKDREPSRRSSARKPSSQRPRPAASNDRPRFGGPRRTLGSRPRGRSRFGGLSFRQRTEMSVYERLREERIRNDRIRDRERREEERRRMAELDHHKFIERKQKEEALRLEREKEKLRIERELLERERADMLKMEREKQRLERERLDREREELRRIAELRRVVPPASTKRPLPRTSREADVYLDYSRKKPATSRYEDRPSSFHAEKTRLEPAIPSSRYEFQPRDRDPYTRSEFDRRPTERFAPVKVAAAPSPRAQFAERDTRRDVTVRSRDFRATASEFRDREPRRSFQTDRQRPAQTGRRGEAARDDYRRGGAAPGTGSVQRRSNFY